MEFNIGIWWECISWINKSINFMAYILLYGLFNLHVICSRNESWGNTLREQVMFLMNAILRWISTFLCYNKCNRAPAPLLINIRYHIIPSSLPHVTGCSNLLQCTFVRGFLIFCESKERRALFKIVPACCCLFIGLYNYPTSPPNWNLGGNAMWFIIATYGRIIVEWMFFSILSLYFDLDLNSVVSVNGRMAGNWNELLRILI